jgi:hypothetical protein
MAESKKTADKAATDVSPLNLQEFSRDADKSTYKKATDPNPDGVTPAPGPSTEQHLGKP